MIGDRQDSAGRWRAAGLTTVSGLSLHTGAAAATGLFALATPATVAWVRLTVAACLSIAWRRPRPSTCTAARTKIALGYGFATAGMNISVYEAIERIPLGTATAIEFCGPVVVGAVFCRSWRGGLAVVVAAAGVLTISQQLVADTVDGVLFAVAAALCYGIKIVLTGKLAASTNTFDDLALAFLFASAALTPLFLVPSLGVWSTPASAALVIVVGALSTVIPYALEQYSVRLVGPGGLAVMLALMPATATLVGAVALHQIPTIQQGAGIVLVMLAVVLRTTDTR